MTVTHAEFPPTLAWTEHERMLVIYRIAGLMQRTAQRSLLPGDRRVIEPETVFGWGERIKLVVSMDRGWLELHRRELLEDLELTNGTRSEG
jgi:hypothetical protein